MSELNQEQIKLLDRFFNRERIMTKELKTLAEKGYIDNQTANRAISGYQAYTKDQVVAIRGESHSKAKPSESQPVIKKSAASYLLSASSQSQATEKRTEQAATVTKAIEAVRQPVVAKTSEQVRERNLQLILIAGVVLLFLAGAVLATTNWLFMTPVTKVAIISLIAVVFYGISALATKLKIPQTAKAFLVLACLFLPFPFVSGAYYHVFGTYLSLSGPGRFIFGCLLTAGFAGLYQRVGKRYQLPIMAKLSFGLAYGSVLFLIRSLLSGTVAQSLVLVGLLFLFNWKNDHIYQQFFKEIKYKEWQLSYLLINLITLMLSFRAIQLTITSTFFLGVYAFLSLQLAYKASSPLVKLRLLRSSYVLLWLSFIVGALLVRLHETAWISLISAMLVLCYSLLRDFLQQKNQLTTEFMALKNSYYQLLVVLFSVSFVNHQFIGGRMEMGILGLLSDLILVATIGLLVYRECTLKMVVNFAMIGYLLGIELIVFMPISSNWHFRLIVMLLIGLVNVGIIKERFGELIGYIMVRAAITYGIICLLASFSFGLISATEQTFWHLVAWGTLLHVCLRRETLNRQFGSLLPIGLMAAFLPSLVVTQQLLWFTFCLSLLVLGSSRLLQKCLVAPFITVSYGVSWFLYGLSLFFLLDTPNNSWSYLLVIAFGGYLAWSSGTNLRQKLFFEIVPISLILTLFYPLDLLDISNVGVFCYTEVIMVVFYVLMKRRIWGLGTISLRVIFSFLWLASIVQTIMFSDWRFAFSGLLLPMGLLATYYISAKNGWYKRGVVLIEGYLGLLLLEMCLIEWFDLHLEIAWLLIGLTSMLTVSAYLLKDHRPFVWPAGAVNLMLSLWSLLAVSYQQSIISSSVILASLLLLGYGVGYFAILKCHQGEQLSLLLVLNYSLLVFYPKLSEYQTIIITIVWVMMILSAVAALKQKQTLILPQGLRLNLMVCVQLIGIVGLASLDISVIWLKVYGLILLGSMSYYESQFLIKRVERSLGIGLGILLINDGLVKFLAPFNVSLSQVIMNLVILGALTVIVRFIWQARHQAQLLEWLMSGMLLIRYLSVSLISGDLSISLYGASFALILVILAYVTKYTAYFINGLIYLVVFVLYSQRHFWAAIPWWLYLALGGMLLIVLGSFSEWNRRNQKVNRQQLTQTVKKYFSNWQ